MFSSMQVFLGLISLRSRYDDRCFEFIHLRYHYFTTCTTVH